MNAQDLKASHIGKTVTIDHLNGSSITGTLESAVITHTRARSYVVVNLTEWPHSLKFTKEAEE